MMNTLKIVFLFAIVSGVALAQNGTAPLYQATTSTTPVGTLTPLFTSFSPVNSVAYSPLNPAPLVSYALMTNAATLNGSSVGNLTCDGGAFARAWSKNNTRFFVTGSGGFAYALELNLTGIAGQLVNTGPLPNTDRIICPIATSWVTDSKVYNVVKNSSPPYTAVTSNTFPGNNTHTSTVSFDLTSGTTCPGIPSGQPNYIGGFGLAQADARFSIDASFTGGQDTGVWVAVYDQTIPGCAVANFGAFNASTNPLGGKYWSFVACAPGTCSPTTTPTGTLASSSACTQGLPTPDCNCWGFVIHNSQFFGNGLDLSISLTDGQFPTNGACSGIKSAAFRSDWVPGTPYTQFCRSGSTSPGGLHCDDHPVMGTAKLLGGDNGVFSIRSNSNLLSYTQWGTIPTCAPEFHISWPNPLLDDSYPAIFASSELSSSGSCGTNYAPAAFAQEVFAGYPNASNQALTRFGPTYNCNPNSSLWASCGGSYDYYFGCSNGIASASNDGNWVMLATGQLLSLGLDSSNKPLCVAVLMHIGQGSTASLTAPGTALIARK